MKEGRWNGPPMLPDPPQPPRESGGPRVYRPGTFTPDFVPIIPRESAGAAALFLLLIGLAWVFIGNLAADVFALQRRVKALETKAAAPAAAVK